jgi:hypothetical protein
MSNWDEIKFDILKGKTLSKIVGKIGDDEMVFTTIDGERYKLYYEED